MTDKELKRLIDQSRYYGIHKDLTPEEKEMHSKISCVETINSCIAYCSRNFESIMSNSYMQRHIDKLGLDVVARLVQGQLNDVIDVQYCVYEDSEGCSYNSIIWKEDKDND
jgi:hypothetical protein